MTPQAAIGYFSGYYCIPDSIFPDFLAASQTYILMIQSAPPPPTFEAAVSELETIVRDMESGELPLEDALAHYKRGVTLLRQCQDQLTSAEKQIKKLEGDSLVKLEPGRAP